jgi:hypothetical protein
MTPEEQKFYAKARKYLSEMDLQEKKVFFMELEKLKKILSA